MKAHNGSRAAAASMLPKARKTRKNQLIIHTPSRSSPLSSFGLATKRHSIPCGMVAL
jgi:hypothetical protein